MIGGVVVRDARLPALAGRYLYGDFCTGRITASRSTDGMVTASDDLGLAVPELTSFGVDALDRIYVTVRSSGRRLPASTRSRSTDPAPCALAT